MKSAKVEFNQNIIDSWPVVAVISRSRQHPKMFFTGTKMNKGLTVFDVFFSICNPINLPVLKMSWANVFLLLHVNKVGKCNWKFDFLYKSLKELGPSKFLKLSKQIRQFYFKKRQKCVHPSTFSNEGIKNTLVSILYFLEQTIFPIFWNLFAPGVTIRVRRRHVLYCVASTRLKNDDLPSQKFTLDLSLSFARFGLYIRSNLPCCLCYNLFYYSSFPHCFFIKTTWVIYAKVIN